MKPYGKCPICLRWIRITNLERIWCHGSGERARNCAGWGKDPVEIRQHLTAGEEQYLQKLSKSPHVWRERPRRKE